MRRARIIAAALSFTLLACPARSEDAADWALKPYAPPPAPKADQWPRERLAKFMHDLADFVYEKHVVRDPARKTYGMTYEYLRDGKWTQEFGLDTMHDGSWFMSAMTTAHRADPAGGYLERIQKYQVPFYVNLLMHGDRLFPDQKGTKEDKQPRTGPMKGYAPRGWDDGAGIDLKGKPFAGGYFTPSNHLAQDLANTLMNVWLTTRDPAIPAAVECLWAERMAYYGRIRPIEFAHEIMAGRTELPANLLPPTFDQAALDPCWSGLYQQNATALKSYNDDSQWSYRNATVLAALAGRPMDTFAAWGAANAYAADLGMEVFFAGGPFTHGLFLFDLQRQPAFVKGEGRLEEHYATSKRFFYGARGTGYAWVAAGVLPELARRPDLWTEAMAKSAAGAARVAIVDTPPTTGWKKDAAYGLSQALKHETTTVTLLADPKMLHLFIESDRPEVTVEIRPAQPVAGDVPVGKIKVIYDTSSMLQNAAGVLVPAWGGKGINEKGHALACRAVLGKGLPHMAEVAVPFAWVPNQSHFINGLDGAVFEVVINGGPKQRVVMLSDPARIRARLESLVLGTIATWHDVWTRYGFIPSGYHPDEARRVKSWELSDTGHYAHLIHTIALWMIYKDGKAEWEIIQAQTPKAPLAAEPLPESVLKAQGLK